MSDFHLESFVLGMAVGAMLIMCGGAIFAALIRRKLSEEKPRG